MPNTSHGPGSLSSVDNALRLLALLSDRRVLRVAEAADLLGVARSTAHRLLSSLRTHGFAVQDKANGAYRPGPVLIELGLAATGRIDIRQLAQPALEELRDRTRETVSVSLLEGRDVRFVDCVEGTRSVRVGLRTGKVMRAHCTAAGKALLAALPLAELHRRYPDGELEGQTGASVTSWAALEAELAEIRAGGLAYNREEGELGICAVAAAVRDVTGAPVAALAVVVPSGRMDTSPGLGAATLDAVRTFEKSLHTVC